MTGIRVTSDIGDLADDMAAIARRARGDMVGVVREGIKVGNVLARDFARATSGTHARLYPGTFSPEFHGMLGEVGTGASLVSGEYGPVARGQGNLAPILERGSINNRAHLNLARSADIIGPSFAGEVSRLPDKWFW